MSNLQTALGVLVSGIVIVLGVAAQAAVDGPNEEAQVAKALAQGTTPVASIAPLEDMVSNSTFVSIDGSDSKDLSEPGSILNYTWEITKGDFTDIEYGGVIQYKFTEIGLYEIRLNVRDQWGNESMDFTAVVSVDDLDDDLMPDWWEMDKFETLLETGSDDFDDDGWTNLQEYVLLTDPAVADPPPAEPGFLEQNWEILSVIAAIAIGAAAVMIPVQRKRRKAAEKKKIEYAIEIEKSLDED
jgi:hypothetical protein